MTFMYRRTGGRVEGSGETGAFTLHDNFLYGVVVDPPTPDGTDLATLKIYDGTSVRNATANEINTFAVAQASDENRVVQAAVDNIPNILKAIVLTLLDEINTLRQGAGLQPRTAAQAVAAIRAKAATF